MVPASSDRDTYPQSIHPPGLRVHLVLASLLIQGSMRDWRTRPSQSDARDLLCSSLA
ncbi:hypothetical protein BDW71DRAFT_189083 [Aspergillus fruticulosus]